MTAPALVLCSALSAFVSAGSAAAQNQGQPPRPTPAAQAPPPAPAVPPAPPAPAPPAAAVAPAPPAPAPPREGQPINIKVELTIVDQGGGATAARKTVSVVVADNMSGFIRSASNYTMPGRVEAVPLNVDVQPQLIGDGKIRLRLNIQYDLPNSLARPQEGPESKSGNLFSTQLRENLSLILENGKPIVAAQSADPVGDRQVTIEVKATVLR